MSKTIRIFKSFEEQEMYFLEYFARLTPSERLQALARIQKNNTAFNEKPSKKITIRKHFVYEETKSILMSYQTLLTNIENNILTITINRPDKLNAINNQVMEELNQVIDEVYNNSGIRSVLITGSGIKAFVAGADISEFLQVTDEGMALSKKGQDIFFKIENSPKPIIAAVNGFALGGGCELAMACHFRIASENARFGQPEINLGLIPGYGGTQRLTQLVGKGRAFEMMMTGNIIDARTAFQYGLVNEVVPLEELLNKAVSILSLINFKAPIALAQCIKAVNAGFIHDQNGYDVEAGNFGNCFKTEDMKEGVMAFLEKRKADFVGR